MKLSWLKLSLNDCRRRPMRTVVTVAGVAIAVAALFSLLAFQEGYRQGIQTELGRLGAHILVVPKGCPYDAASIALHGANWPCYLKSEYLKEVRGVSGVATAVPVLMSAYSETNGTQSVFVGTDQNIVSLKPGWKIDGRFPQSENELLIGAEISRRNQWRVGQSVVLPQLKNARATIAGVLAPTQGADDDFIFLQLEEAQRLTRHPRELTHILVRLTDPDQLDFAIAQLRGCDAGMEMNVVPLAHLFRTIQSLVKSTRLWLGCVALVALLVAGAGVSNAVLMSVSERTREIGVMRAVGASRGDIFRLFWLQTIHVCLAGGVAGVLVAFAASRGIEGWLRARLPFSPTDPLIHWDWWITGGCLLSALILGSLCGFLPAWRAATLAPIEAIRSRGGRG